MASTSGKVLVQNSADILRNEEEEDDDGQELAGLHLIVRVRNSEKGRRRFYAFSSSCYDEKKWWSRQSNHHLRFPFPKASPSFLGSCDGLLCVDSHEITGFSNGVGNKCAVWEPSTKTFQVIPRPSSMTRPCFCSSKDCCLNVMTDGSGLYFDSQSGDYKFISFTHNVYIYVDDDGSPLYHDLSHHVQVYSVRNNLWKELTYPLTVKGKKGELHDITPDGMGVCVDGVCYWLAHCVMDYSFILSFNFVTEEFSSFHEPRHERVCTTFLVELDGSLGLLIFPKEKTSDPGWKGVITLMVYSSSSSSWSRADGFDQVPVNDVLMPLWFGKRNGTYSLLLKGKGSQGDLVEYDYTRKVFSLIHKFKLNPRDCCYAFAYETKAKNNADIWHSSSFHQLQVEKRFAVYTSECDQRGDD